MNCVYETNIYGIHSSLWVKTNGPSVTAIVLFRFGAAPLSKIAQLQSPRAHHGFFSKFLMGGGELKTFGPRRSPKGTKSDGGGNLRKKSDWSQNCLLNAKLGHFLLFLAWNTAFYGTFELKSSQIWHKNVFKFFKFSGTNLCWGWQALVQKRGQVSDRGGDWQNFRRMGGPPSPPQEKNLPIVLTRATHGRIYLYNVTQQNYYNISHLLGTGTTQWLPLWRYSHCSLVPDTVTTGQWLHRTHTLLGIHYYGVCVEICLLGT